jgi:hypothetical protein
MLLDIQNAEIKISYEFKDNNTQGTLEDLVVPLLVPTSTTVAPGRGTP